jgi:glycosyltransferase involved in cell wall biosynthesis
MNYSPLVSVIIPLYNSDRYISEVLQSVTNQTYSDIEVLVIDDGSTDKSLATAKEFEGGRIKIFSQSNKGASAARNYGLREAKGEYIQFLDADDLLSPNKIEEQIKLLIQNPDTIAFSPTIHFFDGEALDNKIPIDEWYYDSFTNPISFLLKLYGGDDTDGGMIQPNSWLTPKNIIDKAGFWNEELSVDDDGEFFCRILVQASGIVFSKNGINYYRKHKKNIGLSSKRDDRAFESIYKSLVLKQLHLRDYKNDPRYKKAFARAFKRLAIQSYPQFKQISTACEKNFKILGGSNHDVTLGGRGIELLKKTFGWKIARIVQYYLRKIYLQCIK